MGYDTTKEEAEVKGRALAKLLGPAWRHEVWENLGWNYNAHLGTIWVYEHQDSRGASYTAYMNDSGEGPGGIWAEHGHTPREAIENTLRKATEETEMYARIVRETQAVLDMTNSDTMKAGK